MTVATVDPSDTLAVLVAAREFLSDPERWTQGTCWRDRDDREVVSNSERVAKACAVGAFSLVVGATCDVAWPSAAYSALADALGVRDGVSDVNDAPNGYARIMAGLDKAIATERARLAA